MLDSVRRPRTVAPWALLAVATLLGGCLPDEAPDGLRKSPPGNGPVVAFDMQAAILPFPNDLLTIPDPTTLTGRRLNVSLAVTTAWEARLRRAALDIDGFGTFSLIFVRFGAPLDVAALAGRGRPPEDDPVLVVDLTPGPNLGERIMLDLGRGVFPATLATTEGLFPQDPRAGQGNLLFETVNEDLDGDGKLSPREDTDGDGVLDRANVVHPGDDPLTDLLTFYERESDTLILRPVTPLRPGHQYAVVLTDGVKGTNGAPVRSPFVFVHHTQQTAALGNLEPALRQHGVSLEQVAFTWVFTTQSATAELESLAEGMHSQGPFAELGTRFGPGTDLDGLGSGGLLRTGELMTLVQGLAIAAFPGIDGEQLAQSFSAVDYLVAGRFVTPFLVDAQVGRFLLNPGAGTGRVSATGAEVPFWCTSPKATATRRPPFPVVLYAHDAGSSRLESLWFSGVLAQWGLATCALELVDHDVPDTAAVRSAFALAGVTDAQRAQALEPLRSADVDGDGIADPGARLFTLDIVQSRALVEQAALDLLQLMRVVRGFDGSRRWSVTITDSPIAGDFDGDGQVDFGGPNTPIHLAGTGFGGMVAGLLAGTEPDAASYASIAGGGGWVDILTRGGLAGMRERLMLALMGPFIAGTGADAALFSTQAVEGTVLTNQLPRVPGSTVRLTNLRSTETRSAVVGEGKAFRVAIPADGPEVVPPVHPDEAPAPDAPAPTGDGLRLQVFDASGQPGKILCVVGNPVDSLDQCQASDEPPLLASTGGWGLTRQTPAFRYAADILQIAFEAADPINYVRDLTDRMPTLIIATLGDPVVPVSSTLALARSAGLLPNLPAPGHAESADALLSARRVPEGVAHVAALVDPEGIAPPALGLVAISPPLAITSADGRSALRFIPVSAEGAHGVRGPLGEEQDAWRYTANLLGRFFARGQPGHHACLWTATAPTDCP